MLSLLWQTCCYIIGLIFIVANVQILKNNLVTVADKGPIEERVKEIKCDQIGRFLKVLVDKFA